jgi:hypothetical protein
MKSAGPIPASGIEGCNVVLLHADREQIVIKEILKMII